MNCVYIYHLASGTLDLRKYLKLIKVTLESKYQRVEMIETFSKEQTIKTVEDYAYNNDIIFSGGDGTFNDVLNAIMKSNTKATLGYIPTGTAHDMARNLNIPNNVLKALEIIINNKTKYHDAIKINNQYALYGIAIGKFTSVSYTTKRKYKKCLGKIAYLSTCFKEIFNNENNIISVNGNIYDTPLLILMNSKYLGSFKVNPLGFRNDGTLDLVAVKNDWFKGNINILKLFLLGINKKYVERITNKTFKVRLLSSKKWCLDGEKYENRTLEINIIPKAFKIYVP